jgi:DNA polymerase-3 subunit epsilon
MIITGLDLETTGLDAEKGHRIIEIAQIAYDLDTRKEKARLIKRIDPERTIQPDAQAVHGIDISDLKGCPTWPAVAPLVNKVLEKSDIVVAHNGDSFDFVFLGVEIMRVGLVIPPVQTLDTMLQGRWACPDGKVPSLKELCWACDVEYDDASAHAADYDVRVMMECVWFGLDRGLFVLPHLTTAAAA